MRDEKLWVKHHYLIRSNKRISSIFKAPLFLDGAIYPSSLKVILPPLPTPDSRLPFFQRSSTRLWQRPKKARLQIQRSRQYLLAGFDLGE